MFEIFAPYVSLFGFSSLTIVAAASAVAWFFPPFRQLAILVAVAFAVLWGAYTKGTRDTQERWDAANEVARAAADQRDKDIGKVARATANAVIAEIRTHETDAERKLREYENERRTATASCPLTSDDIKRLPPIR